MDHSLAPFGVVEPPLEVPAERPGQPPRALTAHDLEGVEVAAQLMLGLVGGRPQDEERKAVSIEPADGRLDVGPRRVGHLDHPPVLAGRVLDVCQHPDLHAAKPSDAERGSSAAAPKEPGTFYKDGLGPSAGALGSARLLTNR